MQTLTLTLRPLSAFGTLPLGDTLFGQLCWLLRDSLGSPGLDKLLEGYSNNKPFAVISDALPSGYVPRPNVPLYFFRQEKDADRKAVKKQVWLPLDALSQPFAEWLSVCKNLDLVEEHIQQHNSISRLTGTTGEGFAPYALDQHWYKADTRLDVHIVFDTSRISAEQLKQAFTDMGLAGFGRDASIGLGKFEIDKSEAKALPASPDANAVLTLAPSAPQGRGFDAENSYYQLFTRFGRHGGQAVQSGKPFKTPVLLAKTGAVFSSTQFNADTVFIGQGLGGNGQLSKQIPETVQQGYAPVIPIHFAPHKESA